LILLIASWKKRLLPWWFMIPALIFALINDLNLLFGYQYGEIAGAAAAITILWPFLMGVILLHKAQTLAKQQYEERHIATPSTLRT